MTNNNSARSEKPSYITLPKQEDNNITIIDFLIVRFPHITKDVWLNRITTGLVSDADGNVITENTVYKPGMRLTYYRETANEPKIPFKEDTIYQNDHIVVACKPHFLPVQPSGPYVSECLLNRLIKSTGIDDIVPLHRIDRETAGIVLFSVNPESRNRYHELFRTGKIRKIYEAIGTPPNDSGKNRWLIENRIEESDDWPMMKNSDGPVNARTLIEKIEEKDGLVKFKIEPFTGKGHQIRLHLQLIGSNIINDRYHPELKPEGSDDYNKPLQLIAKELRFTDPISGEKLKFKSSRKLLF